MLIRTYLDDEAQKTEFSRFKRKVTGGWSFLLTGEWASISGFSGKHRFHYAKSDDDQYWSILSEGFPNRVIAAARVEKEESKEVILGRMLRATSLAGGDSIDFIDECAHDLDVDLLWNNYSGAA